MKKEIFTGKELLVFILGSFIIGMAIAFIIGISELEREAVKHHAAHYDSKTGDFTWNQ